MLPFALYGLFLLLFIFFGLSNSKAYQTIGIIILSLGVLIIIFSTIYQFIYKRLTRGFFSIIILISLTFGAFVTYSLLSFVSGVLGGDHWADNLKIPDNIVLNQPKGDGFNYIRSDSVLNMKRTKTDFELYNSFQPGLYEYNFWTGKIESGTIYLKAFEITQEYALSEDRLPQRSAIKIYNPTDSIYRFGTTSEFTIYEGDWGKPYAARFEVWFKPDNGGQERKLFTKNYKIEGWQR